MNVLQKLRPSFALIPVVVFAVVITGAASRSAAQARTGKTVAQKATESFESSRLETTSLDKDIWMFSGDGGNVTAIVAEGSTLLIDSGVDSRVSELNAAIFKATWRPVTRLVNTHCHFDHTGGNVYFGSAGVTIIAQENVKKWLSSAQNMPLLFPRDGSSASPAPLATAVSDSMQPHQTDL